MAETSTSLTKTCTGQANGGPSIPLNYIATLLTKKHRDTIPPKEFHGG